MLYRSSALHEPKHLGRLLSSKASRVHWYPIDLGSMLVMRSRGWSVLLELSANLAFEYGFASRYSPSRYCVRQQRFIAQDRWTCLLGFKHELRLDAWTSISLQARPIADQQPNCVVGGLSGITGDHLLVIPLNILAWDSMAWLIGAPNPSIFVLILG